MANLAKNCAICNCLHTKKIFMNGSWHDWVAPTQELMDQRKKQAKSRRKSSY